MKKTKKRKPVLKMANHLERDFGHLNDSQKNIVVALLRAFMKKVREISAEASCRFDLTCPNHPPTCETCAFSPATDHFDGFAATAYSLLWTITNDKHFLCHRNQSHTKNVFDPNKKIIPCMSYLPIKALYRNKSKEVARLTMEAILKIAANKKTTA